MEHHDSSIDSIDETSVAVIGMAGRFPGAPDLTLFWENLRSGKDAISRFSVEELAEAGVPPELLENKNYVRAAGMLDGAAMFDAHFFGLTPVEAELTDPQQRLFLEVAHEALEAAGCDPARYQGKAGIFGGASMSTYLIENILGNQQLIRSAGEMQISIGNDKDFLCSRVAYKLGLTGPAVTVQTACSTSLVAVHMACQAILSGECDIALAGGVSVKSLDKRGYLYMEGGINAPDGTCRAFDDQAAGTLGGNGVGIVVLKRLADALADNDEVHAVILGSAINNDGGDKVGFTAPSPGGQAKVIEEALAVANVTADTISCIEAHGTGTVLGDPVEISGLQQVFATQSRQKQFCAIGSVKTNIGHLDAAAGVAGLIKMILALKNREIPASLHFTRGNRHIDFAASAFYVNDRLKAWNSDEFPRRAGVSSFGIGGTNAHVVLEEAPGRDDSARKPEPDLLVLSAMTPAALRAMQARLHEFLEARPEIDLADVSHTCRCGRREFAFRRAFAFEQRQDLLAALARQDDSSAVAAGNPDLMFMFPGQGAQFAGMGKTLYETGPVFRQWVDYCSGKLLPVLGLDLRDLLFADSAAMPAGNTAALLNQTQNTQPALFVVEYAVAKQLNEWGIWQKAMIGHSVGEYVAACLAGVFSLDDALQLVATRGRLIASLAPGSMLAVFAASDSLQELLGADLWIAAINGRTSCTVSGTDGAIAALVASLAKAGIACHPVETSHAFHSGMMEPILSGFHSAFNGVKLSAPAMPFVSGVTGKWITGEQATDPRYWVEHIRMPVRFSDGLDTACGVEQVLFLEAGPGSVLSRLATSHFSGNGKVSVAAPMLPVLQEVGQHRVGVLKSLGSLWERGVHMDWSRIRTDQRTDQHTRKITLPTYPFERKHFRVAPPPSPALAGTPDALLSAVNRADMATWFYLPSWKRHAGWPSRSGVAGAHCNVVLMDDSPLIAGIVTALQKTGETVVTVTRGDAFEKHSAQACAIDKRSGDDYVRLLRDVLTLSDSPLRIVHGWGIQNGLPANSHDQYDGLYSLMYLAQALDLVGVNAADLCVMASGISPVLGNEVVVPEKATLLGACSVIGLESKKVRCRLIEVEAPASAGTAGADPDTVLNEICFASGAPHIAVRGLQRWIPCYERAPVTWDASTPLRKQGQYLVTGGLGGIGFVFARFLAERYPEMQIVLAGRSVLPAQQEWAAWLESASVADATAVKIRRLQELYAISRHVSYFPADIALPADVDALKRFTDQNGPVNGIFHAAGLAGGGIVQFATVQKVAATLSPKVDGTNHLAAAFDTEHLDFLILCSSLNSLAAGVGQFDYCASNAFLDAFSERRRLSHGAAISTVNWAGWRDIGMSAESGAGLSQTHAGHAARRDGISNAEAPRIFEILLSHAPSRVIVSPVELDLVLREAQIANKMALDSAMSAAAVPSAGSARPALGNAYVPASTDAEQVLVNLWEELFGFCPIGVKDKFFELGGHSLLATRLVARIREVFQVDIPLRLMFEMQTIEQLAVGIDELIFAEIANLSEEDALAALGSIEGNRPNL